MSSAIEQLQRTVDHWRGRLEESERARRRATAELEARVRELEGININPERRLHQAHRGDVAWRSDGRERRPRSP